MATNDNEKVSKSINNYCCENCNYTTVKKQNYEKHLLTPKHIKTTNSIKSNNNQKYICDNCNKYFNDRTGLWRHNKNCNNTTNKCDNTTILVNLITELVKENKEFKNMLFEQQHSSQNIMLEQQNLMLEVLKNGTNNNSNNNTMNNSNNKAFNLQFFLNETCKDAMNINEFAESIQLEFSDFENIGTSGYVKGISNIIIRSLKSLDITRRPIHCTDTKRETIYIKNESNEWVKDDSQAIAMNKNSSQMIMLIKKVVSKNHRLALKYKEKYPECRGGESLMAKKYGKMVLECMGGKGENYEDKHSRLVSYIAKEMFVEKDYNSTFNKG
jgi:hypothetical protein